MTDCDVQGNGHERTILSCIPFYPIPFEDLSWKPTAILRAKCPRANNLPRALPIAHLATIVVGAHNSRWRFGSFSAFLDPGNDRRFRVRVETRRIVRLCVHIARRSGDNRGGAPWNPRTILGIGRSVRLSGSELEAMLARRQFDARESGRNGLMRPARGLVRFLYSSNPFYILSADLVFVGLRMSFGAGGPASRTLGASARAGGLHAPPGHDRLRLDPPRESLGRLAQPAPFDRDDVDGDGHERRRRHGRRPQEGGTRLPRRLSVRGCCHGSRVCASSRFGFPAGIARPIT